MPRHTCNLKVVDRSTIILTSNSANKPIHSKAKIRFDQNLLSSSKQTIMKKQKYSSPEILIDLKKLKPYLSIFLKEGKHSFDPIIRAILKHKGFTEDSNTSIPTPKELSVLCGFKPDKFRRELIKCYETLFNTQWEHYNLFELEIEEVEFRLEISLFGNSLTIKTKSLPLVPRVGENFEIPFFRAKLGTTFFYVKSIDHSIEGKKQIVTIWLMAGHYNMHRELKQSKAYLRQEISFGEYFGNGIDDTRY